MQMLPGLSLGQLFQKTEFRINWHLALEPCFKMRLRRADRELPLREHFHSKAFSLIIGPVSTTLYGSFIPGSHVTSIAVRVGAAEMDLKGSSHDVAKVSVACVPMMGKLMEALPFLAKE